MSAAGTSRQLSHSAAPCRVIVCGDRNWTDEGTILKTLRQLPPGSTVIHGACRGADAIAAKVAVRLGLKVEAYHAEWNRHGRAAGPIRNRQMLDDGKPDFVIGFHDDITQSRGTADMIGETRRRGLEFVLIPSSLVRTL